MDRKQLKIAVCRIDSAMQRRGSLNQQPLRFVVDTLKLDVRYDKENHLWTVQFWEAK